MCSFWVAVEMAVILKAAGKVAEANVADEEDPAAKSVPLIIRNRPAQ